ncbi:type III pantothenate kinase [Botrimarina hoheduenensis]|nr:type III pantothenate kinase [Botrimarina hoheduenensis]
MSTPASPSDGLLAIDIGNSRVKLGWFANPSACVSPPQTTALPIASSPLPEPGETLSGSAAELLAGPLAEWLASLPAESLQIAIASVCPAISEPFETAVSTALANAGIGFTVLRLTNSAAPLTIDVEAPALVGADRIAAAVAANCLRLADTPVIVIDIGTAITVDLIDSKGVFQGGAILPGPTLAGAALAERTALLPKVLPGELDRSPDPVGRNTEAALHAGLYWGAVGALRELIARQRDRLPRPPQVLLTGGAAPGFARLIGGPDYTVRHVPHLTLAGIALSATMVDTAPVSDPPT